MRAYGSLAPHLHCSLPQFGQMVNHVYGVGGGRGTGLPLYAGDFTGQRWSGVVLSEEAAHPATLRWYGHRPFLGSVYV